MRVGALNGHVTVPWGEEHRCPSVLVDVATLKIALGIKKEKPYLRALALAKLGKSRIGRIFPIKMRRHAHNLRRVGELVPPNIGHKVNGARRLTAIAGCIANGNEEKAIAIANGANYTKKEKQ